MTNRKLVLALALTAILLVMGCQAKSSPSTSAAIPTSQDDVPRITPQEVKAILDGGEKVVFVDTRSLAAFDQMRIPNALSIPFEETDARHGELPKDQKIVLYCT